MLGKFTYQHSSLDCILNGVGEYAAKVEHYYRSEAGRLGGAERYESRPIGY